jgi:hypothetical protein
MGHSAFQPVRLPDAVWSSQDTVSVLRDRRIGQLFVLARRYAGASQARIAAATGLNQSAERPGRPVSSLVAELTASTPLRGPRVA